MEVGGTTWLVVDEIEPYDEESARQHAFTIGDAKDKYPCRSTQRYPDGTQVQDIGIAQLEGYFEFELHNLTPGRPVVILHRIDYIMGNYELEIAVDGKRVGNASCVGADRQYRWRNMPIAIAAEHVTAGTLRVRLRSLTAGRDVWMYHVWVYQPQ